MIEVFEDVDGIEHREERGVCSVLDEQFEGTLAKFREKLDVGFVSIRQDQLHIKTNGLDFGKNNIEVMEQRSCSQTGHWDEAHQVFIAAM